MHTENDPAARIDPPAILRSLRSEAGLSQAELARLVQVSQPAISRYESGTDAISVDILLRWLSACGRLALPRDSVDAGEPYAKARQALNELIQDLRQRSGVVPPRAGDAIALGTLGLEEVQTLVARLETALAKPLVAFTGTGESGSGTSRLANYVLGTVKTAGSSSSLAGIDPTQRPIDVLPSRFGKPTRAACFIADEADRPATFREKLRRHDVYVFDRMFQFRFDDDHVARHLSRAGGLPLLDEILHSDQATPGAESFALAYVNGHDVLRSSVLVDLPPVEKSGAERRHVNMRILGTADKICMTAKLADASGRAWLWDPVAVAASLHAVQPREQNDGAVKPAPIEDLYLVATYARASTSEINGILAAAAHRLHDIVRRTLDAAGLDVARFSVDELRARMFPFLAEDDALDAPLVADIKHNLGKATPPKVIARLRSQVRDAVEASQQRLRHIATMLDRNASASGIGDGATSRAAEILDGNEEARDVAIAAARAEIERDIAQWQSSGIDDVLAVRQWLDEAFPGEDDREAAEHGALFAYATRLIEQATAILFGTTRSLSRAISSSLIFTTGLDDFESRVLLRSVPTPLEARSLGSVADVPAIFVDESLVSALVPDVTALFPVSVLLRSAPIGTKPKTWRAQVARHIAAAVVRTCRSDGAERFAQDYCNALHSGLQAAVTRARDRCKRALADVASSGATNSPKAVAASLRHVAAALPHIAETFYARVARSS